MKKWTRCKVAEAHLDKVLGDPEDDEEHKQGQQDVRAQVSCIPLPLALSESTEAQKTDDFRQTFFAKLATQFKSLFFEGDDGVLRLRNSSIQKL